MKPADRNLGMDRRITRRDLLQGLGSVAAACSSMPMIGARIVSSAMTSAHSEVICRSHYLIFPQQTQ